MAGNPPACLVRAFALRMCLNQGRYDSKMRRTHQDTPKQDCELNPRRKSRRFRYAERAGFLCIVRLTHRPPVASWTVEGGILRQNTDDLRTTSGPVQAFRTPYDRA